MVGRGAQEPAGRRARERKDRDGGVVALCGCRRRLAARAFREGLAPGPGRPLPEEPEALGRACRRHGEGPSRRRPRRSRIAIPRSRSRSRSSSRRFPASRSRARIEKHVLAQPLALLPRLTDRVMRERALEIVVKERPAEAPAILADWFFKEEDVRTLEAIDRRLAEIEPDTRERTLEKLTKSPRAGPRAFVWFVQRSVEDDSFRARLNPAVLARLLDALTWDELGAAAFQGAGDVRPHGTRRELAREAGHRRGSAPVPPRPCRAITSSSRTGATDSWPPPRCAFPISGESRGRHVLRDGLGHREPSARSWRKS